MTEIIEKNVTVVRIYLTEQQHLLDALLSRLHDEFKVQGVTAFRGIAGFGVSGKMHSSTLFDMSLDLPVVLEFFDTPEKIRAIIQQLDQMIKPGHMLTWQAQVNSQD